MTKQKAIEVIKAECYIGNLLDLDRTATVNMALDMAIQALEQQPSEDCISREAIEKITWEEPSYTDALNVLTEVREKIRQLPSVTPQPKIGKWIEIGIVMEGRKYKNHECDMADAYCCDYCGYNQYIKTNYCPWCGAKMEVDE